MGLVDGVEKSSLATLSGQIQTGRQHLQDLMIDAGNVGVCRIEPELRRETQAGQEMTGSQAKAGSEVWTHAMMTPYSNWPG